MAFAKIVGLDVTPADALVDEGRHRPVPEPVAADVVEPGALAAVLVQRGQLGHSPSTSFTVEATAEAVNPKNSSATSPGALVPNVSMPIDSSA